MKAFVFTKYGSPEVLRLKKIAKPTPKENEVLVRIRATAINDYDWSMIRGKPYMYRLLFGLLKPKHQIPGMELAGTIEAVGANVKSFEFGDAVYGDISEYGFGSFAEYVCIDEKALVHKPPEMSFEEAAAISHAAMLAVQGLVDIGKIEKGMRVLINGAGGGMGTFGLQIAKLYNAEVTGVDTGNKLKMMKKLGFDHIVDYKKEDFTKKKEQYDLILDAKTTRPTYRYLKVLKPNGNYVSVGGYLNQIFLLIILKPLISLISTKSVHMVALKPNKDLDYINQLFAEGKIKPIIDGPYKLSEVPDVMHYFGEGKHEGKIIVSIA